MQVKWKKTLGQHLLHDKNILRKIISAIDPEKGDRILEIGCGSGALTEQLIDTGAGITGIEIDKQFFEILLEKFGSNDNFELIKGDILKLDVEPILDPEKKFIIAGNLPYNITSQILFKLIPLTGMIKKMIFLVQKETAQRMTAKPCSKDRGIMSILCGFYFRPALLFDVKRNSFFPPPCVDSAVIELIPVDYPGFIEIEQFNKFVKASFAQRRKTLRNNLKLTQVDIKILGEEFDLSRRPEELEISEFLEIFEFISERKWQ